MKKLLLIICFSAVFLSIGSCNGDAETETVDLSPDERSEIPQLMMQPGQDYLLTPVGQLTEDYKTPVHLDREAVRSFVFVQPKDSVGVMRGYEQGRIIELSLDVDLSISARINRNQLIGDSIRNLSASILEPYEGVLTLSIEENRLTGNIDLVSENRLFHLRFDSLSGLHYLAEIDRSKLDVIEGSDPLEVN